MQTVEQLDPKLVARLRRTILRIAERESPITRTQLSVQVRPHSEHWDIVLDDLIDRNVIIREAVIKATGRAAVSYRLAPHVVEAFSRLDETFETLIPEEVSEWVENQPYTTSASAAASA